MPRLSCRVRPSRARRPPALLFDCDGVLADTEKDGHRVCFNAAFKAKGLKVVWEVEEYHKLLQTGGGKERMKKCVRRPGRRAACRMHRG